MNAATLGSRPPELRWRSNEVEYRYEGGGETPGMRGQRPKRWISNGGTGGKIEDPTSHVLSNSYIK
eukprot:scaffold1130_cov195-Pinguiococcus_pyrenoidosus.AAC.73